MTQWPEHKNPEDRRKARAPYNFVPLPEQVFYLRDAPDPEQSELPQQDRYYPEAERHTGWLACTLRTETPLYTRCALPPEDWKRRQAQSASKRSLGDSPDFFYTDPDQREPVIPGASLRGMLRNLVEIVGYSKVQPVTDQQKITFRAVAGQKPLKGPYEAAMGKYGSKVKVGYLERENGQWKVRPAWRPKYKGFAEKGRYLKVKDALLTGAIPTFVRFTEDGYAPQYHDVTFDAEDRKGKRGPYTLVTSVGAATAGKPHRGVLVCTGNMAESGEDQNSKRKNYALVLEANERSKAVPIDEQAIQDYLDTLTDFQKTSPPFDEKRGCLVEDHPIFYIERSGKVVAFGHCPNFRIPAWLEGTPKHGAATPQDFVPAALRDQTKTDLAEAMFGYVAVGKDRAAAAEIKKARPPARRGRICVTDATLTPEDQGNLWFDSQQPEVTPQILSSPKPTAFQLYLTQPEPNDPAHLRHYSSKPGEGTVIRGHKLYWHKPGLRRADWEEQQAVDEQKDKQHTRIKPVRAGVTFDFKIYFEDLDAVELGTLLWILNVAAADEYRLKLGMGKPLGLGSVAVTADLHLTERHTRYTSLFQEADKWNVGEADDQKTEQTKDQAMQAYTDWVLHNSSVTPQAGTSLEELPRIKMLLNLLRWQDAPDEAGTSYMTLDADDRAYRERYVLPDPAGVLGESQPESASAVAPDVDVKHRAAPRRRATLADVVHPQSIQDVHAGDILVAEVSGVDQNRVRFTLGFEATGTMGLERLDALVAYHPYFREMYPDLKRRTAAAIFELGDFEDDLYHTKMLVRVREVVERPYKILVKLDFENWLTEETD